MFLSPAQGPLRLWSSRIPHSAALPHPSSVTACHCRDTQVGDTAQNPKASHQGCCHSPGPVEREWALEPDCLGLNPGPATCWAPTLLSPQEIPQARCEPPITGTVGRMAQSGSSTNVSLRHLPQAMWDTPMARVQSSHSNVSQVTLSALCSAPISHMGNSRRIDLKVAAQDLNQTPGGTGLAP